MKPANDNVVIHQLPPADKTPGGILIPSSAQVQQTQLYGEVLHVGPGLYNTGRGVRDPMTAKPGDLVLFSKFAGTALVLEGKACLIMAEKHISAYLESEDEAAG